MKGHVFRERLRQDVTQDDVRRDGEICPACGEGRLHSCADVDLVEFCGRQIGLPLHYSVCDHCGSELAGEAESVANIAMNRLPACIKSMSPEMQARFFNVIKDSGLDDLLTSSD